MRFTIASLLLAALVALAAAAPTEPEAPVYGFINERVVGGQTSAPHAAPWIVAIHWGATTPSQHCAGSLLNPQWVLTAAHCLGGRTDSGIFQLLAGAHDFTRPSPNEQRRNINRARTFPHPQYTGGVGPFDIALIHVAPAFTLNSFVATVTLPANGAIHSGLATLHGWGSTSSTWFPSMPSTLQTVTKPILPFAQCQSVLGAGSPLHSTNLCTGPLTGGVSACGGDSGGPLVQGRTVIGVVSWGTMPCGTVNRPSVYVRVSAFIDWIAQTQRR